MFQRTLLLTFLLGLLVGSGAAQTATISGTVTDKQNAPVSGAKVALRSHGADRMTTTTDSAGRFQFTNVDAGKWEVRATSPNLMPVEYELTVKAGEPVTAEIVLPDRQTVQQQVEVLATREPEDPAKVPAPIQVFSGEELRNRGARVATQGRQVPCRISGV